MRESQKTGTVGRAAATRWLVLAALLLLLCAPAIAETPEDRLRAGNQARNNGDFAGAETIYRSILDEPAVDAEAREKLAQMLSWQRRFEESIELYEELRRRYPEQAKTADMGIARCYAWDRQTRRAVEVIESGLQDNPDDLELLMLLGQVESWGGHTTKALAAFERVMELDPWNRDAWIGKARTLSWSGELVEGEHEFRWLLYRYIDDTEALVGLAYDLIWTGRLKNAREVLERIDPADRGRQDVRLANIALARALGDRVRFRRELRAMREEYPHMRDLQEFHRLVTNEVGPHIRAVFGWSKDSDSLRVSRLVLAGAFPVSDRAYLFFDAAPSDLATDWVGVEDARANAARANAVRAGVDVAVVPGLALRGWGGYRSATDADNAFIGGVRAIWRAHPHTTLYGGYATDYADYTPLAVRNNARQTTLDLAVAHAQSSRLHLSGDLSTREYDADTYSQRRNMVNFQVRWALRAGGRFQIHTGGRLQYFKFDPSFQQDPAINTGYWNPEEFWRVLPFATFTRRFKERSRLVVDVAYGPQQVETKSVEPTGTALVTFTHPLGEQLDLNARAGYSQQSITTGNFYTRWFSVGVVYRFK